MIVRTVKELKEYLKNIPDDMSIGGYKGDDSLHQVAVYPTDYKSDGIDKKENLIFDVD